ncbi:hypothetical protein BO79DRAFT_258630 [Aspergillus costaricaensis CBS 115574]|uniref:Uncharacterized protein n=1 Tax=Aspergillus costaricaensis CBS 115574 TaxID=1448317 RepID=A0ACD1I511_9EURO|nr:hypothetical protein BO79DRAFT_258630 [Aspergillus costaricaensis CBS 115574]RAK85087.1 hypothetical protein BO79DRAFT_258630 [Aspergillus costaricaensis CBS 115574]
MQLALATTTPAAAKAIDEVSVDMAVTFAVTRVSVTAMPLPPCGKDTSTPNATYPLNVCCSEWSFCDTTDDFCGTGCQDLPRSPPAPPTMFRSA